MRVDDLGKCFVVKVTRSLVEVEMNADINVSTYCTHAASPANMLHATQSTAALAQCAVHRISRQYQTNGAHAPLPDFYNATFLNFAKWQIFFQGEMM